MFQKAESNLYGNQVITQDKDSAVLLGIQKRSHQFWPVQNLKEETDFPHRRAKGQWWLSMIRIMQMLVHHHAIEGIVDEEEKQQHNAPASAPSPTPTAEGSTEKVAEMTGA